MSAPVEPRAPTLATLPLWIIAAAITAVSIRYTFFPPCCDTKLTALAIAPKVMMLRDSIVPVPDGNSMYLNESLVLTSANMLELRSRNLRIAVPPEGLLLRRP